LLSAPDGLRRIWFSLDSPSQYFPLTYSVLRLEYSFWGLNPTGYHWVNLLLHAANALLVWRLLRRLTVPGAWFGAAIWALHPVQVETVAWSTELKNVLMCFFFLLTLLSWIDFVEGKPGRRWYFYALALVFYALALASKTTACTLPAALLLILWLKDIPINRQRLVQTIPFVVLGIGMGLLTVWWERFHVGTQGQLFAMGVMNRILTASRAVWFYAGKLFWPVNLTFSYPRWNISATDPFAYVWLAATIGFGATILGARRHPWRGVGAAVLFFAATLSPMLGFIMLYTFVYSFVADHYQYVACLGLTALTAAGITAGFRLPWNRFLKPVVCGALLLLLGELTWRQCGMYADIETLWRTTIARNPGSWMAHFNLGSALLKRGQVADAVGHYQETLNMKPDYAPAYYGLGIAASETGNVDEAIFLYQQALRINPDYAEVHNNLGNALFQKGNVDGAIVQYQQTLRINPRNTEARNNLGIALVQKGRMDEAIADFEGALQMDPRNADALNNLAWLLATARQASLRNGNQAVGLAQEANRLTGDGNPGFLRTLAAAYAETGRFSEATDTAQRALQLAEMQSNTRLADALRTEIKLYQASMPFINAGKTP
jgi:tetratricopeptide (TPR) repeat protein